MAVEGKLQAVPAYHHAVTPCKSSLPVQLSFERILARAQASPSMSTRASTASTARAAAAGAERLLRRPAVRLGSAVPMGLWWGAIVRNPDTQ